MASLEKTEVKLENSGGRVCLGFAFSMAAVSSVMVVILAIFSSRDDSL